MSRSVSAAGPHWQAPWLELQERLAADVVQRDATDWGLGSSSGSGSCCSGTEGSQLTLIAGLDITPLPPGAAAAPPPRAGGGEPAVAALVVLSFPALEPVYQDWQEVELTLPYTPGLLGPRECPAYEAQLARAAAAGCTPQLLLLDGCGRLHPRRFGLACQLGVASGLPAVGVAKSLLCCLGDEAPGKREVRAALAAPQQQQQVRAESSATPAAADCPVWLPLQHTASGEVLGAAVLVGGSTRPLYVSVGHRVSLETAVAAVAACCRHRLPEPLRAADALSRAQARRLALERQKRQQQEEGSQGQVEARLRDRGQPP